jgi:hypothetical protein
LTNPLSDTAVKIIDRGKTVDPDRADARVDFANLTAVGVIRRYEPTPSSPEAKFQDWTLQVQRRRRRNFRFSESGDQNDRDGLRAE